MTVEEAVPRSSQSAWEKQRERWLQPSEDALQHNVMRPECVPIPESAYLHVYDNLTRKLRPLKKPMKLSVLVSNETNGHFLTNHIRKIPILKKGWIRDGLWPS
ncbi:hypothetical protein SJAG_00347 [Schizosaccharomyces japonicus yFS275]|uniref:Uncharacterized protein n=1 Tax=Schizosaccharomyces japonicus (strain yFS275 / FY16936) TaxID=402676 RepID=B6JVD9_SCHJY|nr:hypothetical protein SJAG_00347 [Schizosaccharomyces japonicus yFS275]EEB05340.1 hypothetical protein SJAG_00347 [Schizosaccharomyces japonicus yFS275]